MGDNALIEMHRFLNRARQLEPAWYPVSIAVEAIPAYGSVAGWLPASAVGDKLGTSRAKHLRHFLNHE